MEFMIMIGVLLSSAWLVWVLGSNRTMKIGDRTMNNIHDMTSPKSPASLATYESTVKPDRWDATRRYNPTPRFDITIPRANAYAEPMSKQDIMRRRLEASTMYMYYAREIG